MSSAHYQALGAQTSDEDNEDIEQRRPQHHHYHLRNHSGSTTTACSLAPPVMARKGRRRCLLPLAGGVLFFIAFCYLTLSVDTRLALGLGGGSDTSDDAASHNDLGKRTRRPSRAKAEWPFKMDLKPVALLDEETIQQDLDVPRFKIRRRNKQVFIERELPFEEFKKETEIQIKRKRKLLKYRRMCKSRSPSLISPWFTSAS